MQALREELRRHRSSMYLTADHTTALHVDSEHNRQLESQIAEYIYLHSPLINTMVKRK